MLQQCIKEQRPQYPISIPFYLSAIGIYKILQKVDPIKSPSRIYWKMTAWQKPLLINCAPLRK